jgi:acyl-CoA dehydrogenase
MTTLYLLAVLCIALLAYRRARLWRITALLLALGTLATFDQGMNWTLALGFWLPLLPVMIILNVRPIRRRWVAAPIRQWFITRMPAISNTEREALESGNRWWDGELFSGKPDWVKLQAVPRPALRPEERAYLDGPVEQLCQMLDDWQIEQDNDLPAEVWQFIRQQKMFGLTIPRAYGGMEFSTQGNSAVIQKIASRSQSAAVTVLIPNSVGPSELLSVYGTQSQKEYYLPRLARGDEIPCFAMTGPYAGSDAAGMPDVGVATISTINGEEVPGFLVNFEKRYITLAPVATLLGLAFRAVDPDRVLGERKHLGITCALVPANARGIEIGDRHRVSGSAFMNGPISGRDVFIPLDAVVGGKDRIGQGWRMLMGCVSAGRAVSLPSLAIAGAKVALASSSAYARIRHQFNAALVNFEGIQEQLTELAARCYRMEAASSLALRGLDQGEKPAVISAILKYHLTEDYRRCIAIAMDVHGGKALMQGRTNYLARIHQAVPVAITVEGANILTRSLIIFGQGAIRCHPFLLRMMRAATDRDKEAGLKDFDISLFAHVGLAISNVVRGIWLGLTAGRLSRAPLPGHLAAPSRAIKHLSAAFAVTADVLLLVTARQFKNQQRISGRMADVLSHLYIATAVMKRFSDDGEPESDRPLVDYCLNLSLGEIHTQLQAVYQNFPIPVMGKLLRVCLFPYGMGVRPIGDQLILGIARSICQGSELRNRLVQGIFLPSDPGEPLGRVEDAMIKVLAAEKADAILHNTLGEAVTPLNYETLVTQGLATGLITEEQAEQVRAAQRATENAILVDRFKTENSSTSSAKKAS